jgi:hypothetical protein
MAVASEVCERGEEFDAVIEYAANTIGCRQPVQRRG